MIQLSSFRNRHDRQPRPASKTWIELAQRLTSHVFRTEKDGSLWSPTIYKEGATRGIAGVTAVSCFVADVDDGTPPSELIERWSGLAWCLHSTHSSTAAKPKWRVVFPLVDPVPAAEWPRVWRRLNHHLMDGHCDAATKDASRIHYLPSCPPEREAEAFVDRQEGMMLDASAYPDPPEQDAADTQARSMARREVVGGGTGSGKPGDDFNERASADDVLALLARLGWQEHSRRGAAVYVTRPGKSIREGVSGVIGFPGDSRPIFYCFTSSASPLDARAYAPFGLYGLIEHGGRFDDAAKELATKGYGEQTPVARTAKEKAKSLPQRRAEAVQTARVVSLADFNLTDAGNSERLIHHHGENIRWVRGLGWRVWDGRKWLGDSEAVTRAARETVRALYEEASKLLAEAHKEPDTELRKQLARRAEELSRFAVKSEATRALSAMVEQSKSFAEIVVDASEFGLKPWVVPFQNGVWDRGEWREQRREDLIEHLLPVAYDKSADDSEWLALLNRMTNGDALLARTLQDVAGYCLSGASTLRLLPWAYGPKGTGKSTFAELLQTALGAAGKTLDASLLSGDRETERLGAAVRSMRAVFLPESGRKRLDSELLKSLSGSDRMPCRLLYSNLTFSVMPTWAVFAVSNDPPAMNAHDEALRDRVIALPFVHRLDDGESLSFRDGQRLEEVRRNPRSTLLAGFTKWAVEGLERVHKAQEVYRAPVVTSHTRQFWAETDPLTPFWEHLDQGELERGMAASALQSAYRAWCEIQGIRKPLQGRAFAAACRSAGLEEYRTSRRVGGAPVVERGWKMPPPRLLYDGMTENTPISEKSLKKEFLEDFTKNTPLSVIPSYKNQDELDDPFAGTPGGPLYTPPADEIEENEIEYEEGVL